MSVWHIYADGEGEEKHNIIGGAGDCWCEPEILNFGNDMAGHPARVFIHQGEYPKEMIEIAKLKAKKAAKGG
jgi:hypothetical protein